MIYFLQKLLPHAFFYVSTRMALATITSLLLCIFLGPRFIRKLYELKIGQPIRMEECPQLGELHADKRDTPTMGGVLILFSMLISLLVWMRLDAPRTWLLAFVTVALGALGGVDDWLKLVRKSPRGISGKAKLLVQLIVGAVVALFVVREGIAGTIYLPFFKNPLMLGAVVGVLLMLFVVVGSSNAVNLSDGLDGLAAGLVILGAVPLATLAFLQNHSGISSYLHILYLEGVGEVAVYLSAMIGASLGFLWYNGHPAQLFMGDTGSLALGGVLGSSAVLLRREVLLGLVGAVLVAEALSVILQVGSFRLRGGKRLFRIAPLHHHFEYKGWPETKVVLRFWIVALFFAMIGMISIKLQ